MDLNILPLLCLYISDVVCRVKSNWEQVKQNEEIHDRYTPQKSDLHTQLCRTLYIKTAVKIQALNYSINYQREQRE
jgi:hypothetical protein